MRTVKQFLKNPVMLALVLLMVLLNSSCEKFVDIKTSGQQRLLETATDCQYLLDNYANMNTNYPSDGEASADDYYLSDAGYSTGFPSFLAQTDLDLYVWAPNAIRKLALPQWQGAYQTVYYANLVLETVDKLRGGSTDPATLNGLRGAALFYRSFAFWQLAQLYTKPYVAATANQDPGIPLRLSPDINDVYGRGTVQQTYDRIVQDLQEAVTLLQPTSVIASRPNKAAAYAMLARTYLSMEKYPEALGNAGSALQINSQLLDFNTIITTPFNPRFNKEVIFHAVMVPDPGLNPVKYGQSIARIDPALAASYVPNDFRSKLFIKPNTGSSAGSFRFTGNYEPSTDATFFNGLAVDELYLTRAECYARAGDANAAMADLNTLLTTRWVNGTYVNMTAGTPGDALEKVLMERRKELLMRGLRWTDLRRLNHDSKFSKTLSRTIKGVTYTLPPNDLRYTLLIPSEVINNTTMSQNTRQ